MEVVKNLVNRQCKDMEGVCTKIPPLSLQGRHNCSTFSCPVRWGNVGGYGLPWVIGKRTASHTSVNNIS
jgi:hypothetical protein